MLGQIVRPRQSTDHVALYVPNGHCHGEARSEHPLTQDRFSNRCLAVLERSRDVILVHVIEADPSHEREFGNCSAIKTGDKNSSVEENLKNAALFNIRLNFFRVIEQGCIYDTGGQFQRFHPFLQLGMDIFGNERSR